MKDRESETGSVSRQCSYCNAKEHEIRPVGNFKVELINVKVEGETKLVCQSCKIKVREVKRALSSGPN